jgi:hypothetical protein
MKKLSMLDALESKTLEQWQSLCPHKKIEDQSYGDWTRKFISFPLSSPEEKSLFNLTDYFVSLCGSSGVWLLPNSSKSNS